MSTTSQPTVPLTDAGPRNRTAVLVSAGRVEIEERTVPSVGPRDVLVEVRAVGVCGSDVHYFEHGRIGSFVVNGPLVLGHEAAGAIVAQGPAVERQRVGERVTLEPGVPCSRCPECRSGMYNLCRHVQFLATPPYDGTFAQYVAINQDFAHPLPKSLSYEAGALIEPLSVGLWACLKARVDPTTSVLVTGAGPIGQLAMQAAFAFGATSVAIADVNRARLDAAERACPVRAIDVSEQVLLDAAPFDVLLECSGSPSALRDGILSLRAAGRAICIGMGPEAEVSIPIAHLQSNEVSLAGTFRYANTYPAAIGLASAGSVNLEALIGARYELDDVEQALRAGRENPAIVKAMVYPWGVPPELTR